MPAAKKEKTDHKCLRQRKKDQTTNDGGKQKMAALIRQANSWHQMKRNSWNHLKTPNSCLPASIRGEKREGKKEKEKTPPNHKSLIDKGINDYSHKSTEQK